MIPWELKHVAI